MTWQPTEFTAESIQSENCDRDGGSVRAMVAVKFPSGSVMYLCGHHFDLHEDKMPLSAQVFDTRQAVGVVR